MESEQKRKFMEILVEKEENKAKNSRFLRKEEYDNIVTRLTILDQGIEKRSLPDLNITKAYVLANFSGTKVLLRRGTEARVIIAEDVFDVLQSAHNATGHGGRDTMKSHLKDKFDNITLEHISAFISLCEPCQLKKTASKKSLVVRPILSKELNSRCQVDLIDMQSQPDGASKFILNYQDHLTKFVRLVPLKSKTAKEVAEAILGIMLVHGAPNILQSDNGREFANELISELVKMWPSCKIVRGKPRHSQSQGSVERANQDVEKKLACWMRSHQTSNWSFGLQFVMFQKNNSFHRVIQRTPFEAMFGSSAKQGISSLARIPSQLLATIDTEEQLEALLMEDQPRPELEDDHLHSAHDSQDPPVTMTIEPQVRNTSAVAVQASTSTAAVAPFCDETSGLPLCFVCDEIILHNQEKCKTCNGVIHGNNRCSDKSKETNDYTCQLCVNTTNTNHIRQVAQKGQKRQAESMVKFSNKRLKAACVGDSVMVSIPDVDRGRGDFPNVKAVVLGIENGLYILGTEHGRLASSYTRADFSVCSQKFISATDVPDKTISLRVAARSASNGSGQGFERCACKSGCTGNRCNCLKSKRLCNSKCHGSASCCNKG